MWKSRQGKDLAPAPALFASQSRGGLSTRRVRGAWTTGKRRAGLARVYGFHALRHAAITNVYRSSRDLFLAQRFARQSAR